MTVRIEPANLLAQVSGDEKLSAVGDALKASGFSLFDEGATTVVEHPAGTKIADLTMNEWIAQGVPGARDPWSDPADHTIAGLVGRLRGGKVITYKPCPRRAAGPDLVGLFLGQQGAFGTVELAWVRIHNAASARTLPFELNRVPSVTQEERQLHERLVRELATLT